MVRERLDVALKQLSDVKQLTWIPEQPCTNSNGSGVVRVDKILR